MSTPPATGFQIPFGDATLRTSTVGDAARIHSLISETQLVEENSAYAYLLMCHDFADTTLVADGPDGELLGFVTAYIPPRQLDTVFVWQVGVAPAGRGRGLGTALLEALLNAPACSAVRYLDATISPDNAASIRLFTRLGERHGAQAERLAGFPAHLFPAAHDDEVRYRIGPFPDDVALTSRGARSASFPTDSPTKA